MDNYARYQGEIEAYERESEKWVERSKKIVKLYKDADNPGGKRKRFNVLWSNVETLTPALYARDPKPVADRRNKDQNKLARVSAEVLQRCLSYEIECNGFPDAMRNSVKDRLLPARGVTWHRYDPTIVEDQLKGEKVRVDYVYWEDFGHNVARTWAEVWLVWRKVYLTRDELVVKFPEKGASIPLDHSPKNLKDEKVSEDLKKACIYELWDKKRRVIAFYSKSFTGVIDEQPDVLELAEFFPCQKPLYGTLTTDSLIPTPDYVLYQTQALELENLTARIDSLQKALKVAGVYDSSAPALATLLNEGMENKLIPVQDWAKFAEKNGLDGAVDFLPIKEVGEVLLGLYESRDKVKQDLYEITGLSDIIRGNSEPSETATAQQIKGRFAVLRISDSQADVQRFARDSIRIQAEIIAENFSLETIKAISGVNLMTKEEKQLAQAQAKLGQPLPPNVQALMSEPSWEEVHNLLKDDVLRDYLVDIESDSTIRTDEDADKQSANEFLMSVGGLMDKAVQAVQLSPAVGPLMGEILMFGIRKHRIGRNLEPMFEKAMEQLQQQAAQPKPDPEMQKIQAQVQLEQQKLQAQIQADQAKAQVEAQLAMAQQQAQSQQEAEKNAFDVEKSKVELQQTAQLEQFKARLQIELETHKANLEAQLQREKMAMEQETTLKVEAMKAESSKMIEEEKGKTQLKVAAKKEGKDTDNDGNTIDPKHDALMKEIAEIRNSSGRKRKIIPKRGADGLIAELEVQ